MDGSTSAAPTRATGVAVAVRLAHRRGRGVRQGRRSARRVVTATADATGAGARAEAEAEAEVARTSGGASERLVVSQIPSETSKLSEAPQLQNNRYNVIICLLFFV